MAAEVMKILFVTGNGDREYYPTTLFAEEEAYTGSCTAKSTIYCANIAAALAISGFTKWLRRIPVDKDVTLNLLTNDLIVL